uniref:Uncharacterized protein n=1 Tax=Anguilla anguilla TaxID=7936 RepID=A0A0E9RCQ5_ANGAN
MTTTKKKTFQPAFLELRFH